MNFEIIFPIAFLGSGFLSLAFAKRLRDFLMGRGHADLNPKSRARVEALSDRMSGRTRVSFVLMAVGSLWLAQILLEHLLLA